jgi:GT2 family glycosyltransferase
LVCDSSSNDGTFELMQEFIDSNKDYKIKYFNIQTNTLCAKRNYMFQKTKMDIILTLDDDCVVGKQFLENHLNAHLQSAHNFLILCGSVKFPDNWVEKNNYYKYRDSKHRIKKGHHEILGKNQITVMNMSFVKKNYKLEFFMNEKFIRYGGEDQEFAYRILLKGGELRYLSNAEVIHFEGSTLSNYKRKLYYAARYGDQTLRTEHPHYSYSGKTKLLIQLVGYLNKGHLQIPRTIFLLSIKITDRILCYFLNALVRFPFSTKNYILYELSCAFSIISGLMDQKRKPNNNLNWI